MNTHNYHNQERNPKEAIRGLMLDRELTIARSVGEALRVIPFIPAEPPVQERAVPQALIGNTVEFTPEPSPVSALEQEAAATQPAEISSEDRENDARNALNALFN